MITGTGRSNSLCGFPFTPSQWQELEQQLLTYKYIMSGVPVPHELICTVIKNPFSSSAALFHHQQSLPFGWGCFQVGYGRKIDSEPGRCRRTDGKKWRCSKEAYPDSKYCERHMHRGKNKSKKNLQVLTTNKSTTNNNNTIISSSSSSSTAISCSDSLSNHDGRSTNYPHMAHNTHVLPYYNTCSSFYPFLSSQSSTSSSNCTHQSTQNSTAPHWLLEPQAYDHQAKKEIRYLNEMKRAESDERGSLGLFQDIEYKINKEEKEQRLGADKEDETQKLFHYLGDWSRK